MGDGVYSSKLTVHANSFSAFPHSFKARLEARVAEALHHSRCPGVWGREAVRSVCLAWCVILSWVVIASGTRQGGPVGRLSSFSADLAP